MGDIPKEKELVGKATENARNGAANEVYKNLKELATSPTGFQEASKLLSDPSLKDILPAITLSYLKDGNNLNRWDTQDKDQTLSQSEATAAAQSGTFLDRAIMGSYLNSGTFSADANADGKPGLSVKDLEARSASINAAQVGKVYSSEKDFQALDVTKEDGSAGKDGKVTKKDLQTIRTVGEEKLKDKNLSADDRGKIERSLSAIKQIESTFDQRSADGTSITYAEATGKPSERFNAPDAIQRTMSAHSTLDKDPNSKKTRFDDLATTEKVNGKDEQRISKTRLQDEINTLETRIKQNDGDVALHAANKAIYENMLKDFDKIHPAGKGDGDGMSMADIAAHKQKSELAANIGKVFTDKELAEGVTREAVNNKLAQANADAALGLKSPLAASIETLQYLADDKHPERFDNIAKLGDAAPPPSAGKGGVAPSVPNDKTKIDSEDLKKLGTDKTMLALPKDLTGTATDSSVKPEVRQSVNAMFRDVPVTAADGSKDIPKSADGTKMVVDYGKCQLGFQFDSSGKLAAVFDNPNGSSPSVYERATGPDGKEHWYGRPNGLGNKEGQFDLKGDLDVDNKGTYKRIISGEIGADHIPKPGSAYEVVKGEASGSSHYIVESSGKAFGFGYSRDTKEPNKPSEPDKIWRQANANSNWEILSREKDASGKFTDRYTGDITINPSVSTAKERYTMINPEFSKNSVTGYQDNFSYTNAQSQRWTHTPDGGVGPSDATTSTIVQPGVKDWGNGNKVYYTGQGDNVTSFRYEQTNGTSVQNVCFDRKLDASGNQLVQNGVPVWSMYNSKDASGKPINPQDVAFKPHVDANGNITDTGRWNAPQPPQGYRTVFDWNRNSFVFVPDATPQSTAPLIWNGRQWVSSR